MASTDKYVYQRRVSKPTGHICVQWRRAKNNGDNDETFRTVQAAVEDVAGEKALYVHLDADGSIGSRPGKQWALLFTMPSADVADAVATKLGGKWLDALGGRTVSVFHVTGCRSGEAAATKATTPEFDPESPASKAISVPGLRLIHEFVSEREEMELLAFADRDGGSHWDGKLARRVMHYGAVFNYRDRTAGLKIDATGRLVSTDAAHATGPGTAGVAESAAAAAACAAPTAALPSELQGLVDRIAEAAGAPSGHPECPNQVTFNEYCPGQGISPHIDNRSAFGAVVCSLSLGSAIVMELFSHPEDVSRPVDRALLDAESGMVCPPPLPAGARGFALDGTALSEGGGATGGVAETAAAAGDEAARAAVAAAKPPVDGERPPLVSRPGDRCAFLLPRRSLLVMVGESRHAWRHGILSRRTDLVGGSVLHRERRVSLTVRRVRAVPLDLGGREAADAAPAKMWSPALQADSPATAATAAASSAAKESVPVPATALQPETGGEAAGAAAAKRTAATPELERQFVRAFYDAAAGHFAATRHSPWPRVVSFLDALAPGSLVADVGCGNGKYSVAAPPHVTVVGCDVCLGLVQIAHDRGCNSAVGDAVRCPLRSGRFDAALSIAVLHHLASRERRISALSELGRVVRPGGVCLVQAWARDQPASSKRQFRTQDEMVPWRLGGKFARQASSEAIDACRRVGAGSAGGSDRAGSSSGQGVVLDRYCHLYERGELVSLAAEAGLACAEEWWEAGNWCCVLTRPAGGGAGVGAVWGAGGRVSLREQAACLGITVDGPGT